MEDHQATKRHQQVSNPSWTACPTPRPPHPVAAAGALPQARARAPSQSPWPRRTPPTLSPLLSAPRKRTSSDREAATVSSGGAAGVRHGCATVPRPRGRARASRSGRRGGAALPPVSPAGAAVNIMGGVRRRSRAGGGVLAFGVALRPQLRLRPARVPSWWRACEPLAADSGRSARRLRRCPLKIAPAHRSPRTGRQRLRSTGARPGGGQRAHQARGHAWPVAPSGTDL